MPIREADLVNRYRHIHAERMAGLPICNPLLEVETVGFRALDEHHLGVLLTPWFMNLVLLPGDERWAGAASGTTQELPLPSEACEFTICREDELGNILSAVLFRTVTDFPDQRVAVDIARQVMQQLFTVADQATSCAHYEQGISRRKLLTGLRPS